MDVVYIIEHDKDPNARMGDGVGTKYREGSGYVLITGAGGKCQLAISPTT